MRLVAASLLCCIGAAAFAQKPTHSVALRSSQLELMLDRDTRLPYEYRLLAGNAVIHGAIGDHHITATLFRAEPDSFAKVLVTPHNSTGTHTRCDFFFTAQQDGRWSASFTLRYELQRAAVFVSLENIEEQPGSQLIDVATPGLASVYEEDGGGWLAHGDSGGNLIALSQAKAGHLPPNRFWFGVAATLPVVMIGTTKALCVQEVMAFMDTTELAEGDAGRRRAELGTIAVHRVNRSLAWDMNAEPSGATAAACAARFFRRLRSRRHSGLARRRQNCARAHAGNSHSLLR
jgi:hypothetical protein